MKKTKLFGLVGASFVLAALSGCAGSGAASGGASSGDVDPDATSMRVDNLHIKRPSGWLFVAPDKTVESDTVVVLQGPIGDATLAPVVEISRRKLTAADRRRQPAHILTSLVTEIVQYFDGFEMLGSPEDVPVGGKSGARINLRYSEGLPDGATADRLARFYGVVDGDNIWVLRFMGAPDGSTDADFDTILESIRL